MTNYVEYNRLFNGFEDNSNKLNALITTRLMSWQNMNCFPRIAEMCFPTVTQRLPHLYTEFSINCKHFS